MKQVSFQISYQTFKSALYWAALIGLPISLFTCGNLNDGLGSRYPDGPSLPLRVSADETLSHGLKLDDGPIDWRREVVYFVMIDRFADGDPNNNHQLGAEAFHRFVEGQDPPEALKKYQGGDLLGLLENLAYIKDLGVTTLWLSPVYDNSDAEDHSFYSYHGYHPIDFYGVENRFGDLNLLKDLVQEAHRLELRVLLDIVNNHTGKKHPFVTDMSLWREGGFNKWFHPHAHESSATSIMNWGILQEIQNREFFGLPDLKQSNSNVYDYLLDVSKFWIRELGVDGFRLDAVRHIDRDFWQRYNQDIKEFAGDNFLLIAEIMAEIPLQLEHYKPSGFDGFFDFEMKNQLVNIFAQDSPLTGLTEAYETSRELFGDGFIPGYFIDNHDLARFTYLVDDDFVRERTMLAWTYMFSLTGIPFINYGSETLLQGGPMSDSEAGIGGDFLNRRMMNFDAVERESEWDGLIAFLRRLNAARQETKAMAVGDYLELYRDSHTYIFAKVGAEDIALVSLNVSEEERYLEIPLRFDMSQSLSREQEQSQEQDQPIESQGLVNWSPARIADDVFSVTLKPMSGDIHRFELASDAKQPLPDDYDFRVPESTYTVAGAVEVVFTYKTSRKDVQSVAVGASFNGWSDTSHMMSEVEPGLWTITVELKPNVYAYKFVINGQWELDQNSKEKQSDGHGGFNSVIRVSPPD